MSWLDGKPSLVEQFELGRLTAENIVFPDRFNTKTPLRQDETAARESPVEDQAAAPLSKMKSFSIQESGNVYERLYQCPRESEVEASTPLYSGTRYRNLRSVFKDRVQYRKDLMGKSRQTVSFEAPDAIEERPWEVEDETRKRREQNEQRDWPHAEWVDCHSALLERCSVHRGECLKRLCKRKTENICLERVCHMWHKRDFPDCHHDH